jgi:hypothetical protein
MPDLADELRSTLASESTRLLAITDDVAGTRPSLGKWSPKEVIGHLIDSATNNHGRFVRAQLSDDMVFDGYEQDAWVRVQHYNDRPWMELVSLWRALNGHIAEVVGKMTPESLSRQRTRHNLDQIAWRTVPLDQPVTLDYFVRDYVAHMKHHLGQIP